MQKFLSTLLLCSVCVAALAQQDTNVLGLPAVPQNKAPSEVAPSAKADAKQSASTPKGGASAATAASQAINDSTLKSVLSGGVTMASSYGNTTTSVRVTTANKYTGAVLASQAIAAARLVQRDVKLVCGKLCKPGPMAAPQILKDGTLQFDMVIDGYQGQLSNEDMLSMMMAKPLPVPVPTATKPTAAAPVVAPVPAKTASTASTDTSASPSKAP